MHRREQCYQLSFEDVFLPFGGKLSGDNRWTKLAELIHRSVDLYIKILILAKPLVGAARLGTKKGCPCRVQTILPTEDQCQAAQAPQRDTTTLARARIITERGIKQAWLRPDSCG